MPPKDKTPKINLSFENLVHKIHVAHEELTTQAGRAVNISLTLRNWLIGCYIAEYELHGADKATYGDRLLGALADELTGLHVSNCNRRQVYRYLRFYRLYPEIVKTLSPQFNELLPASKETSVIVGTPSPQLRVPVENLVQRLSYSHMELLVDLNDDNQRAFYEIECLRGNWSVRELNRQIGSLYYERSELSSNKEKLAELAHQGAEPTSLQLTIRDPYVFEFLGLKPAEVLGESHLEDQLLDKLQEFMLELGHGFCFEARQKRILIGDSHNFVDLVFYHRVLKCHVLVELKLAAFSHESIGQLNTYVSWYRKHMMTEGDNPPVGILLCTQKDRALVEYSLAGIDNDIFVSKYLLQLPTKEEMQRFINDQLAIQAPNGAEDGRLIRGDE